MVNTVSAGGDTPIKKKAPKKLLIIGIAIIVFLILVGAALLIFRTQIQQAINDKSDDASSEASGSINSGDPETSELHSKTTLEEDLKTATTPDDQANVYIRHSNDALNLDGDTKLALDYAQKAEQLSPTPASAYLLGLVNWAIYETPSSKNDAQKQATISAFQVYLTRGTDATYATAHPGELLHVQQIIAGLK